MPVRSHPDLTLPLIPESTARETAAVPLAAYVPIAVALIGVSFILIGGIAARGTSDRPSLASATPAIDTIVTGSIAARDTAKAGDPSAN